MKSEETNHGLRFVRTVRGVFLGVAALVLFAPRADAQKLAVKANALSWFTTTPQAEVEGAVGLAGRWVLRVRGTRGSSAITRSSSIGSCARWAVTGCGRRSTATFSA